MHARCSNPAAINYLNYGGRGIVVCHEWSTFLPFLCDMWPRPSGYFLDRIDNDKGYSKENCRWADKTVQAFNSRTRSNNVSGVRGVHREHCDAVVWVANAFLKGKRLYLYKGPDFAAACEARKAWEAQCFPSL